MVTSQELITFGHNLWSILNQNNISVQQMAHKIKYNRLDLSLILSGKKNITLRTITNIAREVNYAPHILFNRNFDTMPKYVYQDIDYMELIRVKMKKVTYVDVDLHTSTLSHILHGRRNNPTFKTLAKLADAVNISMSDLLNPDNNITHTKEV